MATGAIRYNYSRSAWEFSNNGSAYDEFATRQHTHASAEISDASPNANAGTVVRRGSLGEAAFGRVTVGGTARLEGSFLRVGSSNPIVDPDLTSIPNITLAGTTSNFKLVVQDRAGQVNFLWNSTRATGDNDRYLVSSEAASRISIQTGINGSSFGIFSAPPGLANQTITWRQRLLLRADGSLSLGADEILEIQNDSGDMVMRRGKIYAQAFETHSARSLKHNIEQFTENATAILNAIVVHSYVYNRDTASQPRIGIIADDVQDTRIAGENHDRFDIASTVGLLIKAVQELSQRVEILEQGK